MLTKKDYEEIAKAKEILQNIEDYISKHAKEIGFIITEETETNEEYHNDMASIFFPVDYAISLLNSVEVTGDISAIADAITSINKTVEVASKYEKKYPIMKKIKDECVRAKEILLGVVMSCV